MTNEISSHARYGEQLGYRNSSTTNQRLIGWARYLHFLIYFGGALCTGCSGTNPAARFVEQGTPEFADVLALYAQHDKLAAQHDQLAESKDIKDHFKLGTIFDSSTILVINRHSEARKEEQDFQYELDHSVQSLLPEEWSARNADAPNCLVLIDTKMHNKSYSRTDGSRKQVDIKWQKRDVIVYSTKDKKVVAHRVFSNEPRDYAMADQSPYIVEAKYIAWWIIGLPRPIF